MISIDRKMSRFILSITKQYSDRIIFDPNAGGFYFWTGIRSDQPVIFPPFDILETEASLARLEQASLINIIQRIMGGGMIFCITPELLHYRSFWFDRFSKKFMAGFVSGVVVSITANLLTAPIRSGLCMLYRLLLRLIQIQ